MNLIIKSSNNQSMCHEYISEQRIFINTAIMIAKPPTFIYNAIMISYTMNKNRENSLDYNNENLTQSTIKDSDVYDLLLKIPAGKVSTYGDLAKALGNPLASREIGRILGKNPDPIKVPCHRVVRSNEKVGG